MSKAIQELAGAAALPEGNGAAALEALAASLAKVLEHGIQRYGESEALMQELERQVAGGAAVHFVAKLIPGRSLRLRCYLVPPSSEDDPVWLFEVEADGAVARRLLN